MKTINVKIKGLSPMLMHSDRTANPLDEWSKALKEVTGKRKKTDEDHLAISKLEFQASMYWNDIDGYHIPAANLEACLLSSAKMFKQGTLLKQCVFIEDDGKFEFPDKDIVPADLYSDGNYVDQRTVKVQQSKTIRTRPIFREWESEFKILLDTVKMNSAELENIVINAGVYVGLGDYRPRYGRFEVVKFK